ncbi:MAG: ABC transporter substrate-binding protein [Alphaproteobacteria bacterium]|nr:ABC transporter substrate-binding protein [Alphaproteobacteria bacterium]
MSLSRRHVLAAGLAAPLAAPAVLRAQSASVTLGYIPVLGSAQPFVIEGEGWAREAGINLKLIRFDSGPAMAQALSSGQLDFYLAGIGPVIVSRAAGIDVAVVAAAAIEELGVLARGPLATALNAEGSIGAAIARFTREQGRRPKIAAQPPGSVPHTALRWWLEERSKVPAAAVDLVSMSIDASNQALLAGTVDASTAREPMITIVRDRDRAVQVAATGKDIWPGQPGSVLAAVRPHDPSRRAAIDAVVHLHRRATEVLATKPQSVVRHVHRGLGGGLVPQQVFERALVSPFTKFAADPAAIVAATAEMQDYQQRLGVLKDTVAMADLFDHGPWQRSAA